ncbi:MAG: hypothetical protein ACRCXT_19300 [Paraclostridium sp.]
MAINKYIETYSYKIGDIPIVHGQTIVCIDTRDTYFDEYYGERIKISDIIPLETEADRESILVPLPDKLYLVKETNKLYTSDTTNWIPVNKEMVSIKSSYVISDYTNEIPIQIPSFNKNSDTILVYVNSVYLEEGIDYIIDDLSQSIATPNLESWYATADDNQLFNFIVFKNVKSVKSIEEVHSNNNEISIIKKENALLIYTMIMNSLDVSYIIDINKIQYFYDNNFWTKEMTHQVNMKLPQYKIKL